MSWGYASCQLFYYRIHAADQVSFQMIECFSTTAASCNMIRSYKDVLKVARNGCSLIKGGEDKSTSELVQKSVTVTARVRYLV